jgi:hypothetical protein
MQLNHSISGDASTESHKEMDVLTFELSICGIADISQDDWTDFDKVPIFVEMVNLC